MTNFFIIMNLNCNLMCKYCYGESCNDFYDCENDIKIDYNVPEKIKYNINSLINFLNKEQNCNIIFYGGEPLLDINLLSLYIQKLNSKNMLLHTNGIFLDKLSINNIMKLNTISISIDGKKEINDYYRGEGVYDKIIKNIINIRKNGYHGELIARMTVQEETDIFENVTHLLSIKYNNMPLFDSIHWQLNALFWKNDYKRRNFKDWSLKKYNKGINDLVELWLKCMKKGTLLRIYPFIGIMYSLIIREKSKLRCGAGYEEYAIQTDGKIIPCPVMVGMSDYYLGTIFEDNPKSLKNICLKRICLKCEIYNICGGRCLYSNITMKWGINGFKEVCNTVKFLVYKLLSIQNEVEELIKNGIISINDFHNYIKYNSCEIIP